MTVPIAWKPAAIHELQRHFGIFTDWTLCGGCSLDLIVGRQTRPHTDIDVGVFRSQLIACLHAIGRDQVFLCRPADSRVLWDGSAIDPGVHDIWVSDRDRKYWLMQIMVFEDEGQRVFYRRDPRIWWPKRSHSSPIDGLQVLNPLITFLYKANKLKMDEKDVKDIITCIQAAPNQAKRRATTKSRK